MTTSRSLGVSVCMYMYMYTMYTCIHAYVNCHTAAEGPRGPQNDQPLGLQEEAGEAQDALLLQPGAGSDHNVSEP